jgi:hypothetical protein
MAKKTLTKHRLLIYSRLGQQLRTAPFLITIFATGLLFLGWLESQGAIQGVNLDLVRMLWAGRVLLIAIILCSLAIFVLAIIIGQTSHVEVRPRTLHIHAGLLAINISYKRIKQIRLGQLGAQHPEETLRGGDWSLVEPFWGQPCTLVDLLSWPPPGHKAIRRFWSKFMFTHDGSSLMFVVKDTMILNQQLDGRISAFQSSANKGRYLDPIERAIQTERKQRKGRR